MTLRQNPDIIQSAQQDEIVLLNPENGQYLSLDGVGAFIWRLLDDRQAASLDLIIDSVCATYSVEANTAQRDTRQFTEALLQHHLLLVD